MIDTFGDSKFVPVGLFENYGVMLPDWFWDKIGVTILIHESQKPYSYYSDEQIPPTIFLTKEWAGYERTKLIWKSTLVHELGHAYHFKQKIITFDKVAKKVKVFFKKAKEIAENLPEKKVFWLKRENKMMNSFALQEEYNQYNEGEVNRLFSTIGGLFEAVSSNKIGFGHAPHYFNDEYLKFMELFANSADVYFNGNNILKDLFPTLNLLINNFWEDERRNKND